MFSRHISSINLMHIDFIISIFLNFFKVSLSKTWTGSSFLILSFSITILFLFSSSSSLKQLSSSYNSLYSLFFSLSFSVSLISYFSFRYLNILLKKSYIFSPTSISANLSMLIRLLLISRHKYKFLISLYIKIIASCSFFSFSFSTSSNLL